MPEALRADVAPAAPAVGRAQDGAVGAADPRDLPRDGREAAEARRRVGGRDAPGVRPGVVVTVVVPVAATGGGGGIPGGGGGQQCGRGRDDEDASRGSSHTSRT